MCSRFCRRFTQTVPAVVLVATGLLTTGSTGPDSSRPDSGPASRPTTDETAAHGGKVCPTRLPQGPDTGHGFGVEEPAESAPSLTAPESAWICRYSPIDSGSGPDGGGTTWAWALEEGAQRVASTHVPALARGLAALAPVEEDRACTDDLGPRWMLVYSHGTDLTGVVVDDFGCHDVRLTDDPFETVPGEADQAGTVPGVLAAPDDLLDDLEELHHP